MTVHELVALKHRRHVLSWERGIEASTTMAELDACRLVATFHKQMLNLRMPMS